MIDLGRLPDKLILTEDAHASPPKSRATHADARAKAVHRTAPLRAMQAFALAQVLEMRLLRLR